VIQQVYFCIYDFRLQTSQVICHVSMLESKITIIVIYDNTYIYKSVILAECRYKKDRSISYVTNIQLPEGD